MSHKSKFDIYKIYFAQFIFRCVLFVTAAALYVIARVNHSPLPFGENGGLPAFWAIFWVILFTEMLVRLFPISIGSIGARKHLKRTFTPTDETHPVPSTSTKRVALLAAVWIAFNLIFGILYFINVIDAGILVLLTFAYGIADFVCILYFCPIRDWFLKNRCCADCKIYHWDFAMMFTPFAFIPSLYTWSLFGLSMLILIVWEITKALNPERFAENTNAALKCKNCKNKKCRHAKRLARIRKCKNGED